MGAYLRPAQLGDALGALAGPAHGGAGWTVISGANDQ
jgi:hypothetical protein